MENIYLLFKKREVIRCNSLSFAVQLNNFDQEENKHLKLSAYFLCRSKIVFSTKKNENQVFSRIITYI